MSANHQDVKPIEDRLRVTYSDVEEMHEHDWEDISDLAVPESKMLYSSEMLLESSTFPPRAQSNAPRKRRAAPKGGSKTIYLAASPRKSTPRPRRAPSPSPTPYPAPVVPPVAKTLVSEEELHAALSHGARSSAFYLRDVGSFFFFLLKRPLSLFLALWVIAMILNMLSAQIRLVLGPLCIIPGISRSPLCSIPKSQTFEGPQSVDYPRMVEIQSKTFEQLLEESVGSSSVALEIKKAQLATSDLLTVVKTSDLRSRNVLAEALREFTDNARDTARGLQKLHAKVSSSVDNILAISENALQTIEGINNTRNKQFSIVKYVWPFGSPATEADKNVLATTFVQSLSVLSSSLERLILHAEASIMQLDRLEEQLGTIHGIIAREDVTLSAAHEELLAMLWTRLGGNRAQLSRFRGNLQLLQGLSDYRKQALAHVVGALNAMQVLQADMEELRERAAAPELSGGEIPMEVHARAIRMGVQRLNEGRLHAKRLEDNAYHMLINSESDSS